MRSPKIIELLDDSSDDEATTHAVEPKRPAPPIRVWEDGTVEILSDSDDEAQEQLTFSQKKPALPFSASKIAKKKKAVQDDSSFSDEESISEDHKDSKPAALSPRSLARRRQKESPPKRQRLSEEEGIQVLDALPQQPLFVAAAASSSHEDEDIQLVGATGHNALSDFPHSRENCVNFPFATSSRQQHCTHCYCMVCDTPATHCPLWTTHCHAVFADPKWRQAREQTKRQQQQQQQQQQQPPSQVSATPRSTPHSRWMPAIRVKSWWESTSRRELPVFQLLEAVTRVYPRESSPPSPPFVTNLRHYQKQSLAFMQDVENGNDSWEDVYFHDGEQMKVKMRGGWIASEVGMGKSAVVIALVASDPPFQKEKVQWGHLKLKKVKGTVIMTSSSLMGQWEDECKKHAPHLKVVRYHGSATRVTKEQLQAADIIISTATFKWDEVFCKKFLFRRHVMDESHLFSRSSCSAKIYCANRVNAPLKWCVTATPMTASSNELSNQCCFLRMPLELTNSLVTSTETLQKYMIRHIKKQVIDGCSALILPPSTTSFVAIPPSPEELKRYREAVAIHSFRLQNMSSNRWVKHYHLVNGVQYALGGVMLPDLPGESTKIEALRKDLIKMRSKDPNFRAVVFTQQRKMQGLVKAMVAGLGNVQFSCFDGASSAKQRDNNIRNFQSVNTPGAAVFCVTLRTGSVGITLTAATCVFLMEPCFNPVEEIQAAGRIHRLGQTKPVHVTKYVYMNTFEENVEELHQRVASGEIQFTDEGVPKSGIRIILKNVVRSGGTLNGNI